ncbi:MAG TPA: malto-oligosyltrehalose synthase [Thermoanaerobaculia bacterium]|jgi:(1->4)-alpha-D-glucan 1-alpha-D-glucosylmutase
MFRVPISTYRIQFNADFTFEDARKIVAYLAELGISDLYSSPLLRARKGSTHGYDVVDATALNPELGTREDFDRLHEALHANEMGLLLDIVPNHMAASHENAWWMSVLENGAQSRYLHYFDIDWRDNKVLLPILGKPYGEALESGELKLGFDEEGFFIAYYDKRLPVAPQSYKIVLQECVEALPTEGPAIQVRDIVANDDVIANSRFLKDTLWRVREQSQTFRNEVEKVVERFNSDFDLLDKLIDAQAYRLAYWRIASETINYRRFFDVTDLVGVRVENPEVFETRNDLILKLIAEGKITGVRIDHIDGLYEPVNYLTKLQVRLGEPATEEAEQFYVVVEKILEHGEELPENFRCAGTTGYDFLDTANAVFVDPAGLGALTEFYHQYTGFSAPYEDVVYERKKQAIEQLFYGEMRALGSHLAALAVADRNARDFSPSELSTALLEVTACMPVYRTYVREASVSEIDRGYIEHAVAEARKRAKQVDVRLFNFVDRVLLLDVPKYISTERDKWLEFVMRWQQFTGRVMAKGVEDTAFYNYNRLISLNEVGGEPGRGSDFDPVADLHERNERIARSWPNTMNATSTHDTKRAEDVRARISVLSEIPEQWQREVRKWTRANESLKRDGAPDANEELLIYQTLVGMWPLDEADRADVPDRLRAFLEKAAREAKTHSSWLEPNADYEKTLQDFAVAVIENPPFLESFTRFHKRIAFHGMLNSLSQVVLKVCSSGLPDFYQGSEMWDFSLVDPDNRRPVDYEKRMAALKKMPSPQALMRGWSDGRIKLFTTARCLAVRTRNADAFRGAYRAVDTGTPNALAFTRGSDDVLVCVPRLTTQLGKSFPVGEVWGDRTLDIGGHWKNAFTGETIEGDRLALRDVFEAFPVAVLEKV